MWTNERHKFENKMMVKEESLAQKKVGHLQMYRTKTDFNWKTVAVGEDDYYINIWRTNYNPELVNS